MENNNSTLWNPEAGKLYDLDTGKEIGDVKDLQKQQVKGILITAGITAAVVAPITALITKAVMKHRWLKAAEQFDNEALDDDLFEAAQA